MSQSGSVDKGACFRQAGPAPLSAFRILIAVVAIAIARIAISRRLRCLRIEQPYRCIMSQPDTVSVNDGAGDSDHDVDSSLAGDAGSRRRYSYAKCAACRARKKKVCTAILCFFAMEFERFC